MNFNGPGPEFELLFPCCPGSLLRQKRCIQQWYVAKRKAEGWAS